MSTTLNMIFNNSEGKTKTLTLDSPRADVTAEDVKHTMQEVIDKEVYTTEDGITLDTIKRAYVREVVITDLIA